MEERADDARLSSAYPCPEVGQLGGGHRRRELLVARDVVNVYHAVQSAVTRRRRGQGEQRRRFPVESLTETVVSWRWATSAYRVLIMRANRAICSARAAMCARPVCRSTMTACQLKLVMPSLSVRRRC